MFHAKIRTNMVDLDTNPDENRGYFETPLTAVRKPWFDGSSMVKAEILLGSQCPTRGQKSNNTMSCVYMLGSQISDYTMRGWKTTCIWSL